MSDHVDAEGCECEKAGDFHSGVPGILAPMEEGRVVLNSRVERCDFCRRFPSDAAAEAKLRELGMFLASDSRAVSPEENGQAFTVDCRAVLQVTLAPIWAKDPHDAARRAKAHFDWDRYESQAEFAGECAGFIVTGANGPPVQFNSKLEETAL